MGFSRKKSRQNWEVFLTQHPFFHNSVAEKFLCPLKSNTLSSGRATVMSCGISMGSSLWSSSASPQQPPCQTCPLSWEQRSCSFIFSQSDYWEASKALPCHHWAGWLTSPWCLCKDIPCHLAWGQIQSRPTMSIKSIQSITVAWMVLVLPIRHHGEGKAWKKILRVLHKAAQPLSLTNVLHFQKNY